MKVDARPYRLGDVLLLDMQAPQIVDFPPQKLARWAAEMPKGYAWTFWRGSTAIACGGLHQLVDSDVWEAWAVMGRPRRGEWGRLFRFARAAISALPAMRLQATARADHKGAAPTLERLGFEFEGVLRKAGAGWCDLAMYARVKP